MSQMMVAAASTSSQSSGGAGFFVFQSAVIVLGMIVHVLVDRKPNRRTSYRVTELVLIWLMAGTGAWAIIAGLGHIGPTSDQLAEQIGYAQSMFQWEVGWADIGLGVLGVGTIWKRDGWLDAAVVMLFISYGGDAIGHIMEYVAHDNTASANVGAIPTDLLQPLVALGLLIAYRAQRKKLDAARG